LDGDSASNDYAVLLEWDNIYYEKKNKKASVIKKVVRFGAYPVANAVPIRVWMMYFNKQSIL